jgi:hypothetical protein
MDEEELLDLANVGLKPERHRKKQAKLWWPELNMDIELRFLIVLNIFNIFLLRWVI